MSRTAAVEDVMTSSIASKLASWGLVLVCATTFACAPTSEKVVEDEVVEEGADEMRAPPAATNDARDSRSTPTTDAAANDANPSLAESDSEPIALKCAKKTSREDCTRCCDLKTETRDDATACATKAACESKSAPNDCRTQGCAAGESCSECWTGWACIPEGAKC